MEDDPYVSFSSRDETQKVVGVLYGEIHGRWLHITAIWIKGDTGCDEREADLILQAEDEARRRGCVGAYLDTFRCPSREIYEQLGYTHYGFAEDSPSGEWCHMSKQLVEGMKGRLVVGMNSFV